MQNLKILTDPSVAEEMKRFKFFPLSEKKLRRRIRESHADFYGRIIETAIALQAGVRFVVHGKVFTMFPNDGHREFEQALQQKHSN